MPRSPQKGTGMFRGANTRWLPSQGLVLSFVLQHDEAVLQGKNARKAYKSGPHGQTRGVL